MKPTITTTLELVAIVAIAVGVGLGVAMLFLPAGLVAGGVVLLLASFLITSGGRKR